MIVWLCGRVTDRATVPDCNVDLSIVDTYVSSVSMAFFSAQPMQPDAN